MASSSLDQITLKEEDVARLVIEFLSNRDLNISQMSLERETGVYNGHYSDDVLFLRQLILDGQWDDALMFIKPIQALPEFEAGKVCYELLKHKFLELLCLQTEDGYQDSNGAMGELVACLNQIEKYSPSKEEYTELCLLLNLPSLNHDTKYKDWNPSKSRVGCFRQIVKLVEKFMPAEHSAVKKTAKNDRLLRLIVKGLLYETCIDYCAKMGSAKTNKRINIPNIFDERESTEKIDLNLLSWLQYIPKETFSCSFVPKSTRVEVEGLVKPPLTAVWSEMILVTPVKPKVFPHTATPFTRLNGSDIMSKSCTPDIADSLRNSESKEQLSQHMARSVRPVSTPSSKLSENGHQKVERVAHMPLERGVIRRNRVDSLPTVNEVKSRGPQSSATEQPQSMPYIQTEVRREEVHVQRDLRVERLRESEATPKQDDMIRSQDITMSGLWREFQKQKKILEKLIGDDEDSFLQREATPVISKPNNQLLHHAQYYTPEVQYVNATAASADKYRTPVEQMGLRNHPDPQRLTTSTPKGNYARQFQQQHDVTATNAMPADQSVDTTRLPQQRNRRTPFDVSACSTIHSPSQQEFSATYKLN
ncbi:WD repeat-containing protein 47 [Halotydeus destructor]|nr:WD repeat-containing protein 47 [Halotydeus destructor]